MGTTQKDFLDSIQTEDEALEVISSICRDFNFANITYCTGDLTELVEGYLGGYPRDFVDAFAGSVTAEVKTFYAWRKFDDVISSRAGDAIRDAAMDGAGLLEDDARDYLPQLLVTKAGRLTPVVEGTPFDDPSEAHEWAKGHVGSTGLDVLSSRPVECDVTVVDESLIGLPVEQVALVCRKNEQPETTLVAAPRDEPVQ